MGLWARGPLTPSALGHPSGSLFASERSSRDSWGVGPAGSRVPTERVGTSQYQGFFPTGEEADSGLEESLRQGWWGAVKGRVSNSKGGWVHPYKVSNQPLCPPVALENGLLPPLWLLGPWKESKKL